MSFGRRSHENNNDYRAQRDYVTTGAEDENGNLLFVAGLFVVGVVVAGLGLVLAEGLPLTTKAASVHYSTMDLAQGGLSSMMIPEERKKREQRYGIDFSQILTPAKLETTDAMKYVAQACLPTTRYSRWTMPVRAHRTYGQATRYLACAMKTSAERLCDAAERQRLVTQLEQYRDRRQNLLGIERARTRLMGGRMAQSQARTFSRMANMIEGMEGKKKRRRRGRRRNPNPKIGNQLDARVADRLLVLVRAGYISASDFGFMGLSVPEEYAPYLAADATSAPDCNSPGQNAPSADSGAEQPAAF